MSFIIKWSHLFLNFLCISKCTNTFYYVLQFIFRFCNSHVFELRNISWGNTWRKALRNRKQGLTSHTSINYHKSNRLWPTDIPEFHRFRGKVSDSPFSSHRNYFIQRNCTRQLDVTRKQCFCWIGLSLRLDQLQTFVTHRIASSPPFYFEPNTHSCIRLLSVYMFDFEKKHLT